jgi:hypothetical protein
MTHHDSLLPTFLLIPLSLPQVHIVMQRNFVTALPTVFFNETGDVETPYWLYIEKNKDCKNEVHK